MLKICEKWCKLDELMYDGKIEQIGQIDWGSARLHCHCAAILARLGEYRNAIEQLKKAVKYASDFDGRPDEVVLSSLLLGETTVKRIDFDTDDTRSLAEIMRDKWLASPDFDKLRDTEEFQEIINSLCGSQ